MQIAVRDVGYQRMPAGYEKIRDSFKKKGMSTKNAKRKAAMIWNSKNKGTGRTVGRGRS